MYQLRLFGLLVKPSLLSFFASLTFTVLVLAFASLPQLLQSRFLAAHIGAAPSDVSSVVDYQQDQISLVLAFIFNRPELYIVFIAIVAIVTGIVVFITLELVGRAVHSISESVSQVRFARKGFKIKIGEEVGLRSAITFAALVCWIVYWWLWLGAILPFSISVTQLGIYLLPGWPGMSYILTGFVVLLLSAHLHIVLLRLMFLRTRLFGNVDTLGSGLSE